MSTMLVDIQTIDTRMLLVKLLAQIGGPLNFLHDAFF